MSESKTGRRVLLAYEGTLWLEFVVLEPGARPGTLRLAAVDEDPRVGVSDVAVADEDSPEPVVVRLAAVVEVADAVISSARAAGTLSTLDLRRVSERWSLLVRGDARVSAGAEERMEDESFVAHLDAVRADLEAFADAYGGRVVDASAASGSEAEVVNGNFWRWTAGAAIAAAAAIVLWVAWPSGPERLRPNQYRVMGQGRGEVGAELRIGGRHCLALELPSAPASCTVAPGDTIELVYRLDEGLPYRFLAVFAREASDPVLRQVRAGTPALEATQVDGAERCPGGFCSIPDLDLQVRVPARLWVVFSREPVSGADVSALDEDTLAAPPGATVYTFAVTSE